jgi:Ca2+-binding EF-hand superfamily protein
MSDLKAVIFLGLAGLVASALIAFNVQAGEESQRGPAKFAEFDVDGNGFISEDEFNTLRGQRMAAKAAEGKKMRGAATAPAFTDVDADGDGQVNPEELAVAQTAHREQMQAKGHGHGKGKCQGKGRGAGDGMGKGTCMGKGKGKGEGRGEGHMPVFSDFDLDGDGNVIESEFNQAHAARMSEMAAAGHQMKHAGKAPGFSGIDSNGDGQITEDEFAAHQADHHAKKHQDDSE